MRRMPEPVKDVFGFALHNVQQGRFPVGGKPFGEGLPSQILKIVEDYEGNTYRAVYTLFGKAVYVLDVFMKKSKTGSQTPRTDIDRVVARYRSAKADYAAKYGIER